MLIAGTFREYPFSLLLEILLRRGETGLLEVSSTEESGYFYVKNGKVKDGQIGKSKGFAAVKLAGKLEDGSFKFRPLEPADYARVVWQRSFGPAGLSIAQPAVVAEKLRQFEFYRAAFSEHLSSLVQRTRVYAQRGVALWKRVQVEIRVRRILHAALSREDKWRLNRKRSEYPRQLVFQPPSPTIPGRAAIASALHQGVEHNVIFALTVTVLLGVGGLSVYQLVLGNQHSTGAGISVDEHVDEHFGTAAATPANGARPKARSNKRRSTNSLGKPPPGRKPRSTQEPEAVSQTTP